MSSGLAMGMHRSADLRNETNRPIEPLGQTTTAAEDDRPFQPPAESCWSTATIVQRHNRFRIHQWESMSFLFCHRVASSLRMHLNVLLRSSRFPLLRVGLCGREVLAIAKCLAFLFALPRAQQAKFGVAAVNELRRGFKACCERAAAGYRRELGLRPEEALDPLHLARLLNVLVITPDALSGLSASAAQHLCVTDADSWSAVTLIEDGKKLVILNPSHSTTRKNSDLAHELSHIILEHKPTQVFLGLNDALLIREFDRVQEAEAECFSSVLLIPRDALLVLVPINDDDVAARQLGVSIQMFRMRRNVSGVDRQLGRRW